MESGRPSLLGRKKADACGYWSVLQYLANGTKDQEMILKPVNCLFFFNSNYSCGGVEQGLPLHHKLRKACRNVRTEWLCAIAFSHIQIQSKDGKVGEIWQRYKAAQGAVGEEPGWKLLRRRGEQGQDSSQTEEWACKQTPRKVKVSVSRTWVTSLGILSRKLTSFVFWNPV